MLINLRIHPQPNRSRQALEPLTIIRQRFCERLTVTSGGVLNELKDEPQPMTSLSRVERALVVAKLYVWAFIPDVGDVETTVTAEPV